MRHCRRLVAVPMMFLVFLAGSARAQLPADAWWRDGLHHAGLQGYIYSMQPFQGGLVVGGLLSSFGAQPVANIARFRLEGGVLSGGGTLGDGLDHAVLALAEHEGDLVAGGSFTHSGGTEVAGVARWDGESWQPIGAGLPGVSVRALATYGGHLYAGAYRWDGQSWANVLQTNGYVSFLVEHDGLLYVGGSFTTAGGVTVNNAFAWDGASVLPLGSGLAAPVVGAAVIDGVVAFASSAGNWSGRVALWQDGGWNEILSGVNVVSIAAWDGGLAVSCWERYWTYFTSSSLRSWRAGAWTSLGGLASRVMTGLAGGLVLEADTDAVPGIVSPGIIAHDGAAFRAAFAPGDGCDDGFYALEPVGDAVIAAGDFRIAGGVAIDRAAFAWDLGWMPWGSASGLGADGSFEEVALVGGQTYGIYAHFEVDYVAAEFCWLNWQDGEATWQRMPLSQAWSGARFVPDGDDLYVVDGTLKRLALPIGLTSTLPGLVPTGMVMAACVLEGALVAAGRLEANNGVPCGDVLRRDGATWEDLGSPEGAGQVTVIASLGEGGLAAAFGTAGGGTRRVALLDGAGWRQLGGEFDREVTHLACHRGHLFAAGNFDRVGDVEAHGLAMWTGDGWVPVGSGIGRDAPVSVYDVASAGRNLWICGSFTDAGGRPSSGLACWSGDPALLAGMSPAPGIPAHDNVLLGPAWPNPANPRTVIAFDLPADMATCLRIHDVRGALVRTLVDGLIRAGEHQPAWDGLDDAGRPAPSGAYFARLEAGGVVESVKLTLVR